MKIKIFFEKSLVILLFGLLISSVCAAELTFKPQNPSVEIGGEIILSVSGTSGTVQWSAIKGALSGTGTQVTYLAPDDDEKVGTDVVTVLDEAGNTGLIKIIILPKDTGTPSQENAIWEVFTRRSDVQAIVVSEKTLWVGTKGGLEQRDGATGELVRVFTTVDGLPDNRVNALSIDASGGLWIGTWIGGLAYLSVDGDWTVYNTDNSKLPSKWVKALSIDASGRLWIGTDAGLAYLTVSGDWKIFNTENSGLPDNKIHALSLDSSGGLWIGTEFGGLAYLSVGGDWTVFNSENSDLPSNWIRALSIDSSGGVWIGINGKGLAYRHVGGDWTVYNTENSDLPSNYIFALSIDSRGGLWIGAHNALVYFDGNWTIYNKELPSNRIAALSFDASGRLWIGTWGGSLAYRSVAGSFRIYKSKNIGLPSNTVTALSIDSGGGLWIGTWGDGLAYRSVSGNWTVYNTNNSDLPSNWLKALSIDSNDGLWVGTSDSGLAYRSVSGDWTVHNAGLPDKNINTLSIDSNGGLWIGTKQGLAYRSVSGDWTVIDNSKLPSNSISGISFDSSGGVWIRTTGEGLAYRSADGDWMLYNSENYGLPSNSINALSINQKDELWIGIVNSGLAYRNVSGDWTVYNIDNSDLPDRNVSVLSFDSNGVWIGTWGGGLAYRTVDDDWVVYKAGNSGLPVNLITALSFDSSGGLWIGTWDGGLAHLSFNKKKALCADEALSDDECKKLLTDKRAALIIAGGGTHESNTLWDTTAAISNYIYKMLSKRGFDNDEIYYLSQKSHGDFNGDGLDDCIVDAPATPRCRIKDVENPIPERSLNVDDVRQAFAWAKTRGKLDQPLYVFFLNHGSPDRIQLSKEGYLEVSEFKAIIDDYQNETDNEVVLVIDTCYSGVLLQKLIGHKRAIISSTGNGLAYFDRTDKQGYSRFLAEGLDKGMSFYEAFGYARDKQEKSVLSHGQDQFPQWYDGSDDGQWLRNIFINGDFVVYDNTLTVQALTNSTSLSVGQSLPLSAKVNQDNVKRVWAVIKPPKVLHVMDSYGTPILAFPHLELFSSEQENVWRTDWDEAVYNGVYQITFSAKESLGNISASEPITVEVNGGVDLPEMSSVNIQVAKDRYQRGEPFQALLIEELAWGYDLYAAVVLPDGNFFALRKTNQLAGVNEPKKWVGERTFHTPVTLFDLTLPENLPTGQYCLYGILSPENELVLETLALNLSVWTARCFEVF
ncbi:hypothetical protein PN36_31395 [Candidatus Thiomargarita nelsonii]|uniref:Two component regulator propeller domain-containing protein n=1 Tax=Candidatus Thiomargarita nelsonii TaxID=1003181 RepID=A0A0A6P818_9GAMM|nr:hypothetical protein PN36_31395 [Candidatus Thiomargarita nelsonii]